MKRFSAVILAAGVSKRLGFNKLTLKMNGESVIRQAVLPFISAGLGKVFIVTGVLSQDIREGFTGHAVEFIENKDYALGMSTSVKAALPFITDEEGVFFHLGDKPFLEKETIYRMIDMYHENRKKIIVPVFNGEKGHPVLMDVGLYSTEIRSLEGDKGLREIIEKHTGDVIFIKGNKGSIFDIDTIEDIERLKERGYIIEKVKVEDALGMVLAHDITEIIPGKKKDVAFRRGRIIEEGDIERLLDLGKKHLYVFKGETKGIHEEEAGIRIAQAVMDDNMELVPPKEGKVSIKSKITGLFYVNEKHLYEVNRIKNVLLSTVPNRYPVKPGDVVAAAKTIPLYIHGRELKMVEKVAEKGILRISPFKHLNMGLVITGSEVYDGRIQDGSEVVRKKIEGYGLTVIDKRIVTDDVPMIRDAILSQFDAGADIVMTTAGLSVDPDDLTKEGIEATGAEVLFYGTPVFPGAMFLVARLKGKYILGAPACVYYNNHTVMDILLPRILAGERMHKKDIVKLSYGGHCLYCAECHYPACFFGKGP